MANLIIMDSGFVKATNEGTRLDADYMANDGLALSINSKTLQIQGKFNSDATPELNNFEASDVNRNSIENDKISITGSVPLTDTTQSTQLYNIKQMSKTIGYKFIYADSTSSDKYKLLITMESNGHVFSSVEQTVFSVAAAYEHIHVFFDSFQVLQSGDKKYLDWTLSGTILKSEVSTLE